MAKLSVAWLRQDKLAFGMHGLRAVAARLVDGDAVANLPGIPKVTCVPKPEMVEGSVAPPVR